MSRLLPVNNYDAHHRERALTLKASLARRGAGVGAIDWKLLKTSRLRGYDGAVPGGSCEMLSQARTQAKFAREIDAMKNHPRPILGVCFGLRLLGHAFGSRVVRTPVPGKGYQDAEVLKYDTIFTGIPTSVGVYESHDEVVGSLPRSFVHLPRSPTTEICAMGNSTLPIYGVQFHPGRFCLEKPDGEVIPANFLEGLTSG